MTVRQYVHLCKISGLCVHRLRFVPPLNVTDRPTDRQRDLQTDGFCSEYMNSSAELIKMETRFPFSRKLTTREQDAQIGFFAPTTLTFTRWSCYTNMTYVFWKCFHIPKMKFLGQRVQKLQPEQDSQTDRHTTKRITTQH